MKKDMLPSSHCTEYDSMLHPVVTTILTKIRLVAGT